MLTFFHTPLGLLALPVKSSGQYFPEFIIFLRTPCPSLRPEARRLVMHGTKSRPRMCSLLSLAWKKFTLTQKRARLRTKFNLHIFFFGRFGIDLHGRDHRRKIVFRHISYYHTTLIHMNNVTVSFQRCFVPVCLKKKSILLHSNSQREGNSLSTHFAAGTKNTKCKGMFFPIFA